MFLKVMIVTCIFDPFILTFTLFWSLLFLFVNITFQLSIIYMSKTIDYLFILHLVLLNTSHFIFLYYISTLTPS
jgi:hypothetical protein